MRSILLIAIFSLAGMNKLNAQFEYFNSTTGISGDQESELTVDIEVLEDGYLVWGGGVNDDEFYFLRKISFEGLLLEEQQFNLEEGFVLIGIGNSLSIDLEESKGFISRVHVGPQGVRGVGIKTNLELDTLWIKYYQLYDDHTDFFTHTPVEEGYAIAGEYGSGPGERGTFIAMLDTAGQVLWHESIHAPSEGVFRNLVISQLGDKFVISGAQGTGIDTEGYVEILADDGELL